MHCREAHQIVLVHDEADEEEERRERTDDGVD
jgi:hypothetical protein